MRFDLRLNFTKTQLIEVPTRRSKDASHLSLQGKWKPDHNHCMRLNRKLMMCEFCDGQTIKKKVKRQHWLQDRLYIVENVDAEVCPDCGERYFHATTLDAIDRLLNVEHQVKERLSVEVVSLWRV